MEEKGGRQENGGLILSPLPLCIHLREYTKYNYSLSRETREALKRLTNEILNKTSVDFIAGQKDRTAKVFEFTVQY